ncbi:MAG: aminotransferase class V-fold PLP-dependent enzyme [Planctomycetes bacterium]|nr:aminotransferase class V-fold PLP-dependent enzyme [Planctomycetota bacterium]
MSELLSDAERHELFPVTRAGAYLNNAWRGPISSRAAAAAKGYIDGLSASGVNNWDEWEETWYGAKEEFAEFVGAAESEIQFLANASDAFTRIALGIDWKPGDHCVAPRDDYPGVTRALLDLKRRGVELTLVPPHEDGSMPAEDLIAAITDKTKLVAASWVDFRSGYRMDVHALARECGKRNVLCAIDAVQAIGATPVDIDKVGCQFATFASRKFLNGLDSIGVLYVREFALDRLTPHTLGTYSVESPFDFNWLEQPLAPGAARFQVGATSMPQVYALREAMKLQNEVGREKLGARVTELAVELRERAVQAGYEPLAESWPEERRSQIVSIRRTGKLAGEDLLARLKGRGIAVSVRGSILRVSPHWYNTSADLQSLFEAI